MTQIKIQRKRPTAWWPVLLLLLIPLAWYLFRVRGRNEREAGAPRAVPAAAPATAPATPSATAPRPAPPAAPATTLPRP